VPSAPDSDLLRAAVGYAEKGLPVFPCRPDRAPYIAKGFKAASDDPAQVREWWTKYPNALIGMPTGAATDTHVTDVDVKSRDGFATLKKLNLQLDHLPQIATPSGGAHFYHRLGGLNLRCTAGKLGPGIDTRANGGYAILPPSHPDPKRPPYAFVNGSDFLAAPPVPPELVKLLREGHKPKPLEELEEECARVASASPGQRNDVLNKAAFKLAKLVAGGKLKESEVREALTKAALACALQPYEIERTLDSALSAGKRDTEASDGRKRRETVQGRALELPDAVPWEEAVDGAALARALVRMPGASSCCPMPRRMRRRSGASYARAFRDRDLASSRHHLAGGGLRQDHVAGVAREHRPAASRGDQYQRLRDLQNNRAGGADALGGRGRYTPARE